MKQQRNLLIDLMKGIAMIMVILVHSIQRIPNLSGVFDIFLYGQFGCQIFFLASGYLLMASYDQRKPLLRLFYLKRYVSIASGYYLIIIFTFILNTIAYRVVHTSIGFATNRNPISIFCNLLFIHGLFPFCNNNVVAGGWYVGTTMLMYIIFPLIYKIVLRTKNTHRMIFIVMLISCGIAVILKNKGIDDIYQNNGFYYFNILVQLPCFLYGCILYLEKQREDKREFKNYIIGFLFILIAFVCYYFGYHNMEFLFILMPTIFTRGVYYVCKNFILKDKLVNRGVVVDMLISFGRESYYIFLAHPFFVWSMPIVVFKLMDKFEININSNIIYILMLPAMFFFSYAMGMGLKKICTPISKWLTAVAGTVLKVS